MTTHAGLSDDRIEAIIRNHEADPANGDDSHTPREVVQMAREIRAARASARAQRIRLAPFISVTEAIRFLSRAGAIDLSRLPAIRASLEDCHRRLEAMPDARRGGRDDEAAPPAGGSS